MNYYKHSLLSRKKFGGKTDDYLQIHKFIDSSKLFYFDIKHRILLHHTYGIDLSIQKFGEYIVNEDNRTILVRDIVAEHCKEDLSGVVPTLNNWLKYYDSSLLPELPKVKTNNKVLQQFILQPLLMSGNKASLLITHSNFGIFLAKEILGIEAAIELSHHVQNNYVNEFLQYIKLKERWQYSPDLKQLKSIENEDI